jgi:hypothetical protein
MTNFEKDFASYKRLNIQHIAFAEPSSPQELVAFKDIGVDISSLPEIVPSDARYTISAPGQAPHALKILVRKEIPNILVAQLSKTVVKIAPTALVYQIPENQQDLSQLIKNTLPYFDYYVVKLGLVVLLDRGDQIPELLFEVNLESGAPDKTFVTGYDMAPNDKFKDINIISGKVTLGVSKLLKFIPSPAGQTISELINIDINPLEIKWNIKKCQIDAAGNLDYKLYWRLYETSIVQGFEPTIILKVKKGVKKISASAKIIYKLKTGWLNFTTEVRTTKIKIPILPFN